MKIQLEKVVTNKGQSFRLFTPSLRNHFYWHYHPEFELVYVEAAAGIRHVGQHVSSYLQSDLVLIGANIPHLNFDYGLKVDYKQIVVQLKEDFLGTAFTNTPEFKAIEKLFSKAYLGLSFTGQTKIIVVEKLRQMQALDYFSQLLILLEILQLLATSTEVIVLNEMGTSIKIFMNDKIRMSNVYEYINSNFDKSPDVNFIAAQVHLSTAAFCRYFKKQANMTFTEFVNQYRISQAKTLLLQDKNISETGYAVGFESISHFTKLFKKSTGQNPSAFKKQYLQQ